MAFRQIQTTNLDSTAVSFSDPIMVINKSGTINQDIGWIGKVGTNTYSGLIKDSGDGKFYVIDEVALGSNNVNDVNPVDITIGTIVANIETSSVTVTENFVLPKGTALQRPSSPVEGQMWFNTESKMFEGYDGTSWVQLVPSTLQETP